MRKAAVLLMSPSLLSWTIAGNVGTRCRAAWTCRNCSKGEEEVAGQGMMEEDMGTWVSAVVQAEVGCTIGHPVS